MSFEEKGTCMFATRPITFIRAIAINLALFGLALAAPMLQSIGSAQAAIVFSQAPDQDFAVPGGSLASFANDQQIADKATFATGITLGGMDAYGLDNAIMAVGESVRVRIFNDAGGNPVTGTSLFDFTENITIRDTDGVAGKTDPGGNTISRYHVDFSIPVVLTAGTHWFSMSRSIGAFSQLTMNGLVAGDDNSRFVNGPFTGQDVNGDMAFRLFDNQLEVISEPGALAVFGLGLAGIGLMRRRRKTA
jgi:hypothetical protein